MGRRFKAVLLCAVLMLSTAFLQTPPSSFAESNHQDNRMRDWIPPEDDTPLYSVLEGIRSKKKEAGVYSEIPVGSFRVSELSPQTDTLLDYTDWWYNELDDCRYIFLPSTANRSSLKVTYSSDEIIYLNGTPLLSGEMTSVLGGSDSFDIKVGNTDCGKLKVMQSNIGCIYLTTSNGGLDLLDQKRYITEKGSVLMLNAEGNIEYSGEFEKLTAHGNSSWDYSPKKSYNIKLPDKSDLYGMGKAKKWALISNYLDFSMLRNKLIEEMCKSAGVECVMDSVFVDLYADGSYRGTYQLSERVQIQKNRINIRDLEEETEKLNSSGLDAYNQRVIGASSTKEYMENSYKFYDIPNEPEDITGGYLLQFQQWNRYPIKSASGFVTSRGQAIQIDGPEYASRAQVEYIRKFVQEAEDAIYSENGFNSEGKHYSEYIDIDSLAKIYLVLEISQNVDATNSSFYLWKDSDSKGDGKLHFSPAWDYDLCFNNFATLRRNSDGMTGYSGKYDNLFVAYFPIHGYEDDGLTSSSGSGRPTVGISWIGQLYKNEEFVQKVADIYYECFEPFLDNLTKGDKPYLTKLAESILPSAEMSTVRWHTYGGTSYHPFHSRSGETFMENEELLLSYIDKRYNWLSELWMPYTFVRGDVNADGAFSIADAVVLQQWILAVPDKQLIHWQAGDLYKDNRIDMFDLILMRSELIS